MNRNPEHWRLNKQRLRLEGSRCVHCGSPIFPPRPHCSICSTIFGDLIFHRVLNIGGQEDLVEPGVSHETLVHFEMCPAR